ncbi:MAG TPA: DNA topoisomerase IV subunit B, partial [Ilumatobacteraceae bacterium]|nr:DNA topoisomerase IV subunit B [Ilumatobacteraceae bacterium]
AGGDDHHIRLFGQHIRGLLTVFFYRWMPGVLESGRFFVAQPPLYSTIVRGERIYLADDRAKNQFLADNPNHKAPFGRLKGLGEMDAHELKTAIDPRQRRVTQIVVNEPTRLDAMARLLL